MNKILDALHFIWTGERIGSMKWPEIKFKTSWYDDVGSWYKKDQNPK